MLYQVKWSSAYKKAYRRMEKRGMDLSELDRVVDTMRHGKELAPKYYDHELKGKFKGVRECHIKPDWLLTYIIERDVLVLTLLDTGTHAEIFGI